MLGTRLLGAALLLGAGAFAVAAVVAAPPLLRAARPGLRQGLKRGIEIYARVRAAASELVEDVEDMVAEVQAEVLHAKGAAAPERKASTQQ